MHKHSADERLARLAARQHGVVSLAQLRALGLDKDAVRRRVARGHLHRLYRGVYAVGHTALTERSRLLAAALACGPGAALSHRAAARLWRISSRASPIEVTSARARPPGKGVVIHRSPLSQEDRGSIDAIPVTTLARTLVDLADVLTLPQLEDAVHEAEVRRVFDLGALGAARARARGRSGRHKLDRALALYRPRPVTRSDLERSFLRLCDRHGIEPPLVNFSIAGIEVDFHWPAARLAVELDGSQAHRTRRAFEVDRRRDRRLTLLGWRVMRFTWLDLERDPDRVARELDRALRGG